MYLTYKQLEENGACNLAKYKHSFPDNMLITCKALRIAQFKGFNLRWFAFTFISEEIYKKYKDKINCQPENEPFLIYNAIGEMEELDRKQRAVLYKEKTKLFDELEYNKPIKVGDICIATDGYGMDIELYKRIHVGNCNSDPIKVIAITGEMVAVIPINDNERSCLNGKVWIGHLKALESIIGTIYAYWMPLKYLRKLTSYEREST
jgi:hypothetical protein